MSLRPAAAACPTDAIRPRSRAIAVVLRLVVEPATAITGAKNVTEFGSVVRGICAERGARRRLHWYNNIGVSSAGGGGGGLLRSVVTTSGRRDAIGLVQSQSSGVSVSSPVVGRSSLSSRGADGRDRGRAPGDGGVGWSSPALLLCSSATAVDRPPPPPPASSARSGSVVDAPAADGDALPGLPPPVMPSPMRVIV